jgi:hypothetical protein
MTEPEKPVEESTSPELELPEESKIPEDMDLVAEMANRLVSDNQEYGRLVASMLASRQLYAMCLYELERLCEETNFKKATKVKDKDNLDVGAKLTESQMLMLKEVLINSAAVQAQQPFEEQHLFTGMLNTVFPWMRDVVTKHNDLQNKLQKEKFEEAEKERIEKDLVLRVPLLQDADEALSRKKPVMLIGERHLLNWLCGHLSESAMQEGSNVHQIIRLNASDKAVSTKPGVFELPATAWDKCAASNESFQRVYEQIIGSNLTNPADLLIVDDLFRCVEQMLIASVQMSITSGVNEAQKRFKRWTEKAGCLLIGCVPLDRKLRDKELNTPEYETLRMHNILKGVASENTTEDGVEYVKIFVGQHEVGRVSADELETYKESKIIVN